MAWVIVLLLLLRSPGAAYAELLRRADAQAEVLERSEAETLYRRATLLAPGRTVAYERLSRLYLDWGRSPAALSALDRATNLAPDDPSLSQLVLDVHAARGDWPAVAEVAHRLLESLPEDRETYHALASAQLQMLDWAAALSTYEKILSLWPMDSKAHERVGIFLAGGEGGAVEHLLAAETELSRRLLDELIDTALVGDVSYTHARVGRLLSRRQAWALAAYHFSSALEQAPDYADAHVYLGQALDRLGHAEEAIVHLRRGVELAPDSPVAHTVLGMHYERLGDLTAAREAYGQAYDLDPENPGTCVAIGQTWAAEGRYIAAEIWLTEAVTLAPEDPQLWAVLSRFYLTYHITAEGKAVTATENYLELAPDAATAHDLRGWAAIQSGNYQVARQHLEEALDIDPTLAEAYYHLGVLHRAQGRMVEARAAFERATDLDASGRLAPLIERAMQS